MIIERISLEEFNLIGEDIHMGTFGVERPKEMNTFDYALIVRNETSLLAYATIIEHDKESVYMQHGGAFTEAKGTAAVARAYYMMINWLKERYRNAFTQVLNLNVPMLKLAMSAGFIITGVNVYADGMWLQLLNDFRAQTI